MAESPQSGQAGATKARDGMIDPASLMTIRNLELRARVVVEGFWSGIHRSPYHGFSVEFSEYRQYSPGDDIRHVDWKLFARSDRHFIRKFEDETNLRCHLIHDGSKSMDFGSGEITKSDYAATLCATLAWFLFQQGDAVGLFGFDDGLSEYLPARNRPGHLRRLMLALDRETKGSTSDLCEALRKTMQIVRKRGMMVVVSDLLTPLDELERELGMLKAFRHEVEVMQVLDPAEVDFNLDKTAVYVDVETGEEKFLDPTTARDDYLSKFNEHQERLRLICEKLGIGYRMIRTDQPFEVALFDFLKSRMARGGSGGAGSRRARA